MKKIELLTLVLLINIVSFAQKKFKWSSISCYPQISIGSVNHGYSKDAKGYLWGVAIKNVSAKSLQVAYRFSVGGESYAGGGYQVTRYLEPGEVWAEGEGLFTALLFKNSSTNWEIEVKDLCYRGEDCFKIGYVGCNGERVGGKDLTNKSNSNNSNTNSGTPTQALLDELNSLCAEASGINNSYTNGAITTYCTGETYNDTESGRDKIKGRIKFLKDAIKTATANNKDRADRAARQKEREDKTKQLKKEVYDMYMEDGNKFLAKEEFDKAIENFNVALSKADEDADRQAALDGIARAQKAKEDFVRRKRVGDKLQKEEQLNQGGAAMGAATLSLMSFIKDGISYKPVSIKFQAGMGAESLPIILNEQNRPKSSIDASFHQLFYFGLRATFLNNKGVNLSINPFYQMGLNLGQQGVDGVHSSYGGTATLVLGYKAKSPFKLFAEAGYAKRDGEYNYDADAASSSGGVVTTATDIVENGVYDYSVLKVGAGILINIMDEYGDKDAKEYIIEQPSFLLKGSKPIMVGNLYFKLNKTIIFDISYSKNYFIGGTLNYPRSIIPENKSYWSLKLIRQGKLL
jgi:hypothetical protein